MKQADRHVESVLATLDILDCFLKDSSLTVKQLIDATGLTRNRVMRLTGTLVHKGYLSTDADTGAFHAGPRVFALSRVFERNRGIASLVRPILRGLALKTGESVSLYVRQGLERVVAAREEGTQAVRYTVTEGQHMDLHAGAGGKVLLAYSPEEVLEAALKHPHLPHRTPHTITNREKLLKELKRVRQQGYAVSIGERNPDACAIAVPLFDAASNLVGALGIAGPISRFTPPTRNAFAQLMLAAGLKISRQLGWENAKLQIGTLPGAPDE
jgi:DNA-binding IclR family transcriptional regulator